MGLSLTGREKGVVLTFPAAIRRITPCGASAFLKEGVKFCQVPGVLLCVPAYNEAEILPE